MTTNEFLMAAREVRIESTIRSEISAVAKKWIGTPFFPHMAKRGIGADCVQLAAAVYQEAGVLPNEIELPKYHLSAGDHINSSVVIDWLLKSEWFQPEAAPETGSLITFQIGRVEHHVGVMTTANTFVHAVRRLGVVEGDLRDPAFARRLRSSWGPTGAFLDDHQPEQICF